MSVIVSVPGGTGLDPSVGGTGGTDLRGLCLSGTSLSKQQITGICGIRAAHIEIQWSQFRVNLDFIIQLGILEIKEQKC